MPIVRTHFDHPVHRQSICVGIRRVFCERLDAEQALVTRQPIEIPCNSYGRSESLRGTVEKITIYRDGRLVEIKLDALSVMTAWSVVSLWIPSSGQCGILTPWPSHAQSRRLAAWQYRNEWKPLGEILRERGIELH